MSGQWILAATQAVRRRVVLSSLAIGALFLGAVLHPAPVLAQLNETLGPGDSVRITVFANPELTTEARISAQGTVLFPLLGEVKLAGMTPTEATTAISDKLKTGQYVNNPQVSLNVTQVRSRQGSVLGQVVRPGRYALDDTSAKLTDILALAGGISPGGDDIVTVMVSRNGTSKKVEIDVPRMYRTGDYSNNIQVENGDTIFVQRAPVFYIYGEVQRAGSYRLEPKMNVMQALSLGGGLTVRGTERGMRIHRLGTDGSLARMDANLGDPVQANDIIYVRESLF